MLQVDAEKIFQQQYNVRSFKASSVHVCQFFSSRRATRKQIIRLDCRYRGCTEIGLRQTDTWIENGDNR